MKPTAVSGGRSAQSDRPASLALFQEGGDALAAFDALAALDDDAFARIADALPAAARAAAADAAESGAVVVPAFDALDTMAGQGTVGLEILEQVPDVGTIVVPTGGGGLLAGCGAWLRERTARLAWTPPHAASSRIGKRPRRASMPC